MAIKQSIDDVVVGARFDLGEPLPVLRDGPVTLRELQIGGASTLLAQVSPPEVLRHITPAPNTRRSQRRASIADR